ncbi:hypothetical protein BDP27DRAFT_1356636 [Rhodocollybia butyracea]|uniref:Uncharacterized protein n=1 Tax=Rhodocollybia butyracea TaxID=206335 RepID=A0A9P5QC35_9AGAR|nr:hypothetical protein BDP27DRAFT_1356636 [Rhodocollybia butyracea]
MIFTSFLLLLFLINVDARPTDPHLEHRSDNPAPLVARVYPPQYGSGGSRNRNSHQDSRPPPRTSNHYPPPRDVSPPPKAPTPPPASEWPPVPPTADTLIGYVYLPQDIVRHMQETENFLPVTVNRATSSLLEGTEIMDMAYPDPVAAMRALHPSDFGGYHEVSLSRLKPPKNKVN